MSRPKLWGPDLLRGDESNDVEDGDLMVGVHGGLVRLAVREEGQWVLDAFARKQDTWRMVMKSAQTVRAGAMALDPDLQVQAPARGRFAIRGRLYFDMQAGFRWRHVGPEGGALRLRRSWLTYSDTASQGVGLDQDYSSSDMVIASGGGGVIELEGVILVGASGGTVGIAWASSQGAQAVMRAGSYMEFRHVV